MRPEKVSKSVVLQPAAAGVSDLHVGELVPVAIPATIEMSRLLKADLEAHEIHAMLECEMTNETMCLMAGVPVLVPESYLEQASRLLDEIEMSARDDDFDDLDDFEDDDDVDDLDEMEDDEDEFDEDDEDEEDDEFDFDEEDEEEGEAEAEDGDDLFYDDEEE